MASGDIYLARVQYTFLSQQMENTFYLRQESGVCDASGLNTNLDRVWLPSILAIQSASVTHDQIVTINLDDTGDFDTIITGDSGVRAGEPAPPMLAFGYSTTSTDRILRAGGKRFGGISEADVDTGVADVGVVTALTNLGTVLGDLLENVAETCSWALVLHRPEVISPPADAITVDISSVLYRRVTTQNSRKFPA